MTAALSAPIPRTFDKARLARALGTCIMPCGDVNYRKLRKEYLTDNILKKIGADTMPYRRLSMFTAAQSRLLIKEFNLTEEDFNI